MSEPIIFALTAISWFSAGFFIRSAWVSTTSFRSLERMGAWSKHQSATWRSDPDGATLESLHAYDRTLAYTSGWIDGSGNDTPSDRYAYTPGKDRK